MSRVRPGVLLTNANWLPANALMALDLPEFDRPANAISPTLAGTSSSEATLLKKEALRKSNMDGWINFARISAFCAKIHGEKNCMKRAWALLSFAVCAGPLAVAEPAAKADSAKGQNIANKICTACHGADGNSPTPANPKLASQVPEYLQKQLANFKPAAGKRAERENPIMGGMVAGLSVEDMRDVAAYYAAQQVKPGAVKNRDALALGRKIWRAGDMNKGLPACAACHGASGAGLPAQYPRLAGQYAEYTEAQLKAFRSGERRNDANKMMQAVAARMSDPEIRAVADYVAGLR